MKTFRIKPDISGLVPVWALEEKKGFKWHRIFKDPDILVVKKMKDHLLQLPTIYTIKNNTPDKPLRSRPSNWLLSPKVKFLKIKRSDLPDSLKDLN